MLFDVAACYMECVDQYCEECHFYFKVGDKCVQQGTHPLLLCDPNTSLIRQKESSYLECNGSQLELRECPPGSYYEDGKGCVDPTIEPFMQGLSISGSGRVGDVCQYNTDCLGGMYCSGGVCTCLSTYIMREYYCYEKVNPNQPGCTYDVQCEAVWPGAKCRMDSSVGTCRCPEETHIARETRDGWVCVSLKDHSTGTTVPLYFVCPLPEGAGFKIVGTASALNDPNPAAGSLPVGCTVGSTATVEPVVGLHGGGACIWPSDGEYIGDIYDCIQTSPHVNLGTKFPLSPYAPSADGVCCPSRALACIQPQMTGPNPTEPRWWYNSVTGT
ncbi:EB module [Oesophagostomum dentatum]|uniref:EB module n=1 Tax=Oesophagostomum dentatum TaxID=61180 RepID=A0A0B1SWB2_OESDE|nr:EB module [Oesophagostomum dentatum]